MDSAAEPPYELALYRQDEEAAMAVSWLVHVFVDRESRRSVQIIAPLRDALPRLIPAP
jgi:hypothetical protein